MKRITLAVLVTAAALGASSARADTRVSIGVNLGVPAYRPAPPTVVYAPAPVVNYAPPTVVVAPSRSYWKDVEVRTWVPERWVVRHNRWGRPERYCEPGYYALRTERVWVDGRDARSPYRDGRGAYSYGYDNHRGGWNR
ncbi:hypothetical protein [Horticoccus sp. 23ND18S-11]|uniref:hypothetical protein n=1 Tax=Horticoccus sp. 23ND18S-11 TaxID=3391832 RepID=UPI0039C978EC